MEARFLVTIASILVGVGCGSRPSRANPGPEGGASSGAAIDMTVPSTPVSASEGAPARGATARSAEPGSETVPLPDEPSYRSRPDHKEECLPSLATMPPKHYPAPFEKCSTHSESWSSPPGGHSLHFRYRKFSVELTRAARTKDPDACCYAIWRFP